MKADFPHKIFRAYDIRGGLKQLTPSVLYSIAHALAEHYQVKNAVVVIGYDARLTSPSYAHVVAKVLMQFGLEVKLIGCCSSPMLYYIAKQHAGHGIMITASHNPKSDNGIKWVTDNMPPSQAEIQAIGQSAAKWYVRLPTNDILDVDLEYPHEFITAFCVAYRQSILSDIQLQRPFKVVLDALNGSAGACALRVLEELGCEVIALRCQPNGHFPEHAPDPSQPEHLINLQQAILQHQADLGIALDGDGDRLVLVDEKAQIISPDQLISFFAAHCLKAKPNHEVVYDVKCSQMVEQNIVGHAGKATMIRTGSSFLRKYLLDSKQQAIFGGEYAGHYVFNDGRGHGYDDGIYAACRFMEYLSHSTGMVSQNFKDYPARFGTDDLYISSVQVDPRAVLSEVEQQSEQFSARVTKIDGIRLDFEDGFGIIRASNTGEYFTVRFDADQPARLVHIQQQFISMLQPKYPSLAQEILKVLKGDLNAISA